MKQLLFKTRNDWAGFVARLTIGLILFPHGAQKILGWFGGPGFTNAMHYFTDQLNIPWIISLMVIMIEFFGSLALVLGFASRLWSLAVIILFAGIILTQHLSYGFFINWTGQQSGEGFEYHLLVIGLSLAIFLNGSGKFSLDASLSKPN